MNKIEGQMKAIDKLYDDVMGSLNNIFRQKPAGYETTIEINGYEFPCIVDFEFIPACRGSRDDYGMQVEPDEPASVEMGEVWIFDEIWQIVDIPEKAMKDVLDEILEHELS